MYFIAKSHGDTIQWYYFPVAELDCGILPTIIKCDNFIDWSQLWMISTWMDTQKKFKICFWSTKVWVEQCYIYILRIYSMVSSRSCKSFLHLEHITGVVLKEQTKYMVVQIGLCFFKLIDSPFLSHCSVNHMRFFVRMIFCLSQSNTRKKISYLNMSLYIVRYSSYITTKQFMKSSKCRISVPW